MQSRQRLILCSILPEACVKEGERVRECVAGVLKSIDAQCGSMLTAYSKCIDKNHNKLEFVSAMPSMCARCSKHMNENRNRLGKSEHPSLVHLSCDPLICSLSPPFSSTLPHSHSIAFWPTCAVIFLLVLSVHELFSLNHRHSHYVTGIFVIFLSLSTGVSSLSQ